jgi:hypothetical protein
MTTKNYCFTFAAIVLMLGMTISLSAQTVCPTPLGKLYAGFPDAVKEASAQGTKACVVVNDIFEIFTPAFVRLEAYYRFAEAKKVLEKTIAYKYSGSEEIRFAKYAYVDAQYDIELANRPMHEANAAASLAYRAWVADRQTAGLPFDQSAQDAFQKWSLVVQEAERLPTIDDTLCHRANEAQAERRIEERAREERLRAADAGK